MPIIKVYGLPEDTTEGDLMVHSTGLIHAVLSVEELGLKSEKDVTVLYPSYRMRHGLGEDIVVEIVGLCVKPERTKLVQDKLAAAAGCVLKAEYRTARVEVFVYPFDPSVCGFWRGA